MKPRIASAMCDNDRHQMWSPQFHFRTLGRRKNGTSSRAQRRIPNLLSNSATRPPAYNSLISIMNEAGQQQVSLTWSTCPSLSFDLPRLHHRSCPLCTCNFLRAPGSPTPFPQQRSFPRVALCTAIAHMRVTQAPFPPRPLPQSPHQRASSSPQPASAPSAEPPRH
jgi:hypothetical protein